MTIPTDILLYVAGAIFLAFIGIIIHLEIKVKRLTAGKDGKSLEDTIVHIKKGLESEQEFKRQMQDYLTLVEKRLKKSVRGVGTVRFNAFKGTGFGGNMSFATAYVTELGDGVIISSLSARERNSIFSKPIQAFKSEFELTPEETEALDIAKSTLEI